jgi:hypothetical protein
MLGELFCQIGEQMLQKIKEHYIRMARLVVFNAAVSNKQVRHPQVHMDVKVQPECINLMYLTFSDTEFI